MEEPTTKKPSPLCPNCGSDRTHRSRRIGATDWLLHYVLFKSPYRCQACDQRFFRSRFHQHDKKELHHHPA